MNAVASLRQLQRFRAGIQRIQLFRQFVLPQTSPTGCSPQQLLQDPTTVFFVVSVTITEKLWPLFCLSNTVHTFFF